MGVQKRRNLAWVGSWDSPFLAPLPLKLSRLLEWKVVDQRWDGHYGEGRCGPCGLERAGSFLWRGKEERNPDRWPQDPTETQSWIRSVGREEQESEGKRRDVGERSEEGEQQEPQEGWEERKQSHSSPALPSPSSSLSLSDGTLTED